MSLRVSPDSQHTPRAALQPVQQVKQVLQEGRDRKTCSRDVCPHGHLPILMKLRYCTAQPQSYSVTAWYDHVTPDCLF